MTLDATRTGSGASPSPLEHELEAAELVARALDAWQSLSPGAREPERVEVLLRRKKSSVCRLVGPDGEVIAKRARRHTGVLEQRIYAEILPELPISALRCYGLVEPPGDDPAFGWLFLEDAGEPQVGVDALGDPRLELDALQHAQLAAGWLATLHASSAGSPRLAGLPERSPAQALKGLRLSREIVCESLAHPVQPEDPKALAPVLAALDVLEEHWPEVEARCDALPRTLVHGDFVPKNMGAREGPEGRELLVYDWEHSGYGLPGLDLGLVDLDGYARALSEHWSGVDEAFVRSLSETGRYFRLLDEVRWAAKRLSMAGSEYFVQALGEYARELDDRFRAEGWQPIRT
jgi:hypothetical protein